MSDVPAGVDDPDATLMTRVGRGDLSAFRALVDKYQGPLVHFLYHVLLDHGEAEDAAQDVFLKVYRAAERYRPDAKFATWFYRIATNTALNVLKTRTRRPTVSLDALLEQRGPDTWPPSPQIGPDRQAERDQLIRAVGHAFRRFPDRQRMAVVLHRFEGLSYREISEVLSTSVDAVDALLRRAKADLREALIPWA